MRGWQRRRREIEEAAKAAELDAVRADKEIHDAQERHNIAKTLVAQADQKHRKLQSEIRLNHFTELLQAAMRSQ